MLLALCAVALVVAAIAWFAPARESRAVPYESVRGTTPTATHDAPLERAEPEAPRVPTPMDPPAPALTAERFEGLGRIQGEVLVAEHVPFPSAWTLVLEPSPVWIGSERAVTKRLEFQAGERGFDVEHIPLAGYRVRIEAAGLNSTAENVLLVRGSESVFVTLRLSPAGFIDGRVLASDGAPADGVAVVLESRATGVRSAQSVNADGSYMFRDVLDGEYRLYVGVPESPLLPPGDVAFRAPSLRFRDLTLPPTGTLVVETRAETGASIADVEITGFGALAGSVRVRSDFSGRAVLNWLLPGEYRLEGRAEDGRKGRVNAAVVLGGEPGVAVMHLR